MMDLVNMTEDEFRLYKQETLRRLVRISEAESIPLVAFVTLDGCGVLANMNNGKMIYSMGGDKD